MLRHVQALYFEHSREAVGPRTPIERSVLHQVKCEVDRFVLPDGHGVIVLAAERLEDLGSATGHLSFIMSCYFTNQVLVQLDILNKLEGDKGMQEQCVSLAEES